MSATGSLMPVDEAHDYLLDRVVVKTGNVNVPLEQALGQILAEAQTARIDVPAYDNSAMDGFAVNTRDLSEDQPQLKISQTIAAGHAGEELQPATAARIFTGAVIPDGANAVVIQEDTRFNKNTVTILKKPDPGQNIRSKGHDIDKDSQVLAAGHRLLPQDIGLLSSLGISGIKIQKPLSVAIINTGDEIVASGQPLKPGQIYDSNSYTLHALLQKLGFNIIKLGIIEDNLASTEKALLEAAERSDCIITTGGVSVGDEDYVKKAVENLGELSLWKLAIKPGKPFSFGTVNSTPFFGLPGNPVAVFVTFCMLVRPYLLKMQGVSELSLTEFWVKADFEQSRPGSRQEYIRVRLQASGDGGQSLVAYDNQSSSLVTSLSWADGLAVIPINSMVAKGDLLRYIPFKGLL